MSPADLQRIVLIGLVLGVTAALVVWWLEKFETKRLLGEVQNYLRAHDIMDDIRPPDVAS